jgi:ankyrin repeat protein
MLFTRQLAIVGTMVLGLMVQAAADDEPIGGQINAAASTGRIEELHRLFKNAPPSPEQLNSALVEAIRADQIPTMEFLFTHANDSNQIGADQFVALLSLAVRDGHREAAEALIQGGAKPTLPEHWAGLGMDTELAAALDANPTVLQDVRREDLPRHPLHVAAANGQTSTIDLLLSRGLSVNLADTWQMTPLHEAAVHGHVDMVKHLLAKQADPHARAMQGFKMPWGTNGNTPLHLAVGADRPSVVAPLIDAGAKLDDFHRMLDFASANRSKEMVNVLIAKRDKKEWPALLKKAVEYRDGVVLEALIGQNVDIAKALPVPPIHWAMMHDLPVLALLFIDKGADIHEVYDVGTPLGRAAERGYDQIVERLLELKADVDFGTTVRTTPLQFAVENGHVRCVELLLDAGANTKSISAEKRSELEKSTDPKYMKIVELLQRAVDK